MVGPPSDEERTAGNLKLQVGFVLVVMLSAVGITLAIDPSVIQLGGAAAGGLVVGFVLTWYVTRTLREFRQNERR